jgi:hypothetical protein
MTTAAFNATSEKINVSMPIPRYDIYATIHKAMRHRMGAVLLRIGSMEVNDAADRTQALRELEGLFVLCVDHIRHENDFIHPAIEALWPGGSRRVGEQHEDHLKDIAQLREEARCIGIEDDATTRSVLAVHLYRQLALFVADNFQHMHLEETANNAALWDLYTDDAIIGLHGRLMASIAPAEHLALLRWTFPAMTPGERGGLLSKAAKSMPPDAFRAFLAAAREALPSA